MTRLTMKDHDESPLPPSPAGHGIRAGGKPRPTNQKSKEEPQTPFTDHDEGKAFFWGVGAGGEGERGLFFFADHNDDKENDERPN